MTAITLWAVFNSFASLAALAFARANVRGRRTLRDDRAEFNRWRAEQRVAWDKRQAELTLRIEDCKCIMAQLDAQRSAQLARMRT